jgi:hypothetical protein
MREYHTLWGKTTCFYKPLDLALHIIHTLAGKFDQTENRAAQERSFAKEKVFPSNPHRPAAC